MKILIFAAAIFAVLALTAGGRSILVWATGVFKPFVGIVVFLFSAHTTIIRHFTTSRSVIYPSMARKTVYRDANK